MTLSFQSRLQIGLARLFLVAALVFVSACGVKGKPLPPLEPISMGRGGPAYLGIADELREKDKNAPLPEGKQNPDEEKERSQP